MTPQDGREDVRSDDFVTRHHLPESIVLPNRQDYVVDRCVGRRVLHLGCVDSGLLAERLASGRLLHRRLAAVAQELYGVDNDEIGLKFLTEHGFQHLVLGDVCEPDWVGDVSHLKFDVIVASEIIEHLSSPGLFLSHVKRLMEPQTTELLVTVPNAFSLAALREMLRKVELVHPDHNYWFSYYTITNLLRKSGFETQEVLAYSTHPRSSLPKNIRSGLSRKATHPDPARRCVRTLSSASGGRRSLILKRARRYVRRLPQRALVASMYGRNPFWADGIIVVARLPMVSS